MTEVKEPSGQESPAPLSVQREKALELFLGALDEFSGALKVLLGVNAGAVVLFVNLLVGSAMADRHLASGPSWLLVVSVFSFGASAVLCAILLLWFGGLRMNMATAMADQSTSWRETLDSKLDKHRRSGKAAVSVLIYLMGLAILSAAASLIGLLCISR